MDLDLLRIDLDLKYKKEAIELLKIRLSYFHDLNFLSINNIKKIELIKKSSYGCKIYLDFKLKDPIFIIALQLLLNSDYQKEVNTIINHYKLNMEYSNRLFNCKKYKDGKIKIAKKIDITKEIQNYILSKNRKKNYN